MLPIVHKTQNYRMRCRMSRRDKIIKAIVLATNVRSIDIAPNLFTLSDTLYDHFLLPVKQRGGPGGPGPELRRPRGAESRADHTARLQCQWAPTVSAVTARSRLAPPGTVTARPKAAFHGDRPGCHGPTRTRSLPQSRCLVPPTDEPAATVAVTVTVTVTVVVVILRPVRRCLPPSESLPALTGA
jgi:hypothetical protein